MADEQKIEYPRQGHVAMHAVADLQHVIEDLQMHGFNRADISVVAMEETIKDDSFGGDYCRVNLLTDSEDVKTEAPAGEHSVKEAQAAAVGVPTYIGAMAAALAGAASGGAGTIAVGLIAGGVGGAAIGGLLARWVGENRGQHLQHQLECGGLLLWVTIHDAEQEKKFIESLRKFPDADYEIN